VSAVDTSRIAVTGGNTVLYLVYLVLEVRHISTWLKRVVVMLEQVPIHGLSLTGGAGWLGTPWQHNSTTAQHTHFKHQMIVS
jgi:hypothetical protein